jgi:DNA-binding CsgD family transcriptional regulator
LRAAQVEIALAAGAIDEAEAACSELEATESTYKTSGFKAEATRARGAVLLAVASAEAALPTLRSACRQWRELGAPYEAACACLLLARAYDAMGDVDASHREREAAADEFERLGAAAPLPGQGRLAAQGRLPGGLTPRQAEILALVAEGKSNREIAAELVISQKTVARHLENIFAKLGVGSRSAAAAYAVDRRLARGPRG